MARICINCNEPLPPPTHGNEKVVLPNQLQLLVIHSSTNSKQVQAVSIKDALIFIFGLQNVKFDDTRLTVCNNCGGMLATLYRLHRELYQLSKADSYLKDILQIINPAPPVQPEPDLTTAPAAPTKKFKWKSKDHIRKPLEVDKIVAKVEVTDNDDSFSLSGFEHATTEDYSLEEPELEDNVPIPKQSFHKKKRATQIYNCPECNKEFKCTDWRKSLEMHINRIHRRLKPFPCDICGKPHADLQSMKRHKTSHISKDERLVPQQRTICYVCGVALNESSLKQHMTTHDEIRKPPIVYKCDNCPQTYLTNSSLQKHRLIHEDAGYFRFKCDACEEGFKTAGFLREHYLFCPAKAKERPHQCEECGKRFKLKQHLALHLVETHHKSEAEARAVVYPGLPFRRVRVPLRAKRYGTVGKKKRRKDDQ